MPLRTLIAAMIIGGVAAGQTLNLPPRPLDSTTRLQIIQSLASLSREAREDSIFALVMRGNVPDFMRKLVPVTSIAPLGVLPHSVTYYVTPDYFAVGSDSEYFLTPMTPLLAQRLADSVHCVLPTRKMVNQIYAAAPLKLAPSPIPPSAEMITVPVFAQHDSLVWSQRKPRLASYPQGTLVGGTKKDVIISNKIRTDLKTGVPKPVVIYGWHQLDGTPIQPLYNGHGEGYADYSHGIRLVQDAVELSGMQTTISAMLRSDSLSSLLSDEGTIAIPRYGNSPTAIDEKPATRPGESLLLHNYPNPFNPATVVSGQSPVASHIRIAVYDVLGREAAVLMDEQRDAGAFEVKWNAGKYAGGVYMCRMEAESFVKTMKMLLVK
jgi:hypothetical protein